MKKWLILILLILAACTQPIPENKTTNSTGDRPRVQGVDVKYCEALGYKYEYVKVDDRKRGYCVFPNGERCESFDFVTGKCGREFSLCELKGYTLKIGVEQHSDVNITYAICIFPDGSYCKEVDFFHRKCHITW